MTAFQLRLIPFQREPSRMIRYRHP